MDPSDVSAAPADTRERFQGFFRWTLETEYPRAAEFLQGPELDQFRVYFDELEGLKDPAREARWLRGLWRGEIGWAARWIAARAAERKGHDPVKVMDAGCGFGTYAMAFASCGGQVTGADLRMDRLDGARRRLEWHAAQTGRRLDVRYEYANLTKPWDGDYDLVWTYNAFSHIDPIGDFLDLTRRHLRPGGVLVIGDINGGNPKHQQRLESVRHEVHQEYVSDTGERHAYAVEATYSPDDLRKLFGRHGLRMAYLELYYGGLGKLPDGVYEGLVRPIGQALPFLASRARRQLAVAAKA
jgi:2-polyprenyl-3-methyl-5-hydroxy-6-metoxy-1,4-benzoquinol methylase